MAEVGAQPHDEPADRTQEHAPDEACDGPPLPLTDQHPGRAKEDEREQQVDDEIHFDTPINNRRLAGTMDTTEYHTTPVREFHAAFGHPVVTDPSHVPPLAQRLLRVQMLATELVELARAFGVELRVNTELHEDEDRCVLAFANYGRYDPVEAADALGDLRYLVDGGNLICGFPGEGVLAEIHRSNMSKLGADGQPVRRADGKILKGPNYFKPDIRGVLGFKPVEAA